MVFIQRMMDIARLCRNWLSSASLCHSGMYIEIEWSKPWNVHKCAPVCCSGHFSGN